ncbi:MAG: hypothetical protein ACREYF_23415 [Gammaproteobacteria bacterium]
MTGEKRGILNSLSRRLVIISSAAGACVFVCAAPVLLWVAGSGVAASLICTPQEALAVAGVSGLLVGGVLALRMAAKPSTSCDCAHTSIPSESSDGPIACDLTVFTTSERAEHRQLGDSLLAQVKQVIERSDGFTLMFDLDATMDERIERWLAKEKLCCPFFSFETIREQAPPSLKLRISGPAGSKPILQDEFGARGLLARVPVLATAHR